jgi:Tfp pilus assembly protein PilW
MKSQRERGFTLIELTLVLGVSVLVATALIGMFQAHVQMLTQAAKFKFLAQDAPFIGLLLTRTIGNAEDYRMYDSGPHARSAIGTPILTTASAVRLWMRQPNSTFRQAVVSFETVNSPPSFSGAGIYFFLADSTGTFSSTPAWEIAASSPVALSGVTFNIDPTTGVMLVKLTGSYNDWYQFAAEKK